MRMEKITGKHLALGAWIVAAAMLFLNVRSIVSLSKEGELSYYIPYIISMVLAVVLQCVLGYAMYREKNDRFTVFVVLLYCFVDIMLPVLRNLRSLAFVIKNIVPGLIPPCVLIAGLFLRRKADLGTKIQKNWFVPAVVYLVVAIARGSGIRLGTIIYTVNYLILGFWLWSYLDVRNRAGRAQETKEGQRAYFEDLLKRGVISQQEYDEKIKHLGEN